jgi:hypothetical protein
MDRVVCSKGYYLWTWLYAARDLTYGYGCMQQGIFLMDMAVCSKGSYLLTWLCTASAKNYKVAQQKGQKDKVWYFKPGPHIWAVFAGHTV